MSDGHPAWARIQVIGMMTFGIMWFPVSFLLFLCLIPRAYLLEKRWVGFSLSVLVLLTVVVVHAFTCWRVVEDRGLGLSMLDLPYALATFLLLSGISMMPFRLHRIHVLRKEKSTRAS